MQIWCNDNVYSDANANIPHINIKMLTMSGVHWWLILHVPETVLIDNNLHCFKPIPTHCNSFAENVSRMWLNIHSAWAQDLGQQAEAWWKTSIWKSNRKVVIKQVFVTAITKNYGYSKWIAWRHQAITFHADSEVQWYSSEVNFTGDTSTKNH